MLLFPVETAPCSHDLIVRNIRGELAKSVSTLDFENLSVCFMETHRLQYVV